MKVAKRIAIHISGIVQGVGFRPTVYRYAIDNNLTGIVENSAQGVFIEIQGDRKQIELFTTTLENSPPPLAKIETFKSKEITLLKDEIDFQIVISKNIGEKDVEISPDLATCKDCLNEIKDPKNRRYRYSFTNCTNCGPRFSIIKDRPYDRSLTSMSDFTMCDDCQKEYDNPLDRRFHAQPNACPKCGPQLSILDNNEIESPLDYSIEKLKEGKILAIKGIGGFNLCCLPTEISNLRKLKNRPSKAFALMMKDIETVEKFCELSIKEKESLLSPVAPIVLLKKRNDQFDSISPDNNYLGIILPYSPLHYLIMEPFEAIVFTSANKADEPIAIDDNSVRDLINEEIADLALTNNREIAHRSDDSIIQFIDDRIQTIRRSRGIVPTHINTQSQVETPALAMGANMKNTFAIRKTSKVYISQHIGELNDIRNYDYQKEQIDDLTGLLEISPAEICCDAHPGYENSVEFGSEKYKKVYHHHAHMLSVMGEHNLLEKDVLGIICDGTGFGPDGNIWGCEFLHKKANERRFTRKGHLDNFFLAGGERSIYEIDRIAVALTQHDTTRPIKTLDKTRRSIIGSLIKSQINCPQTSSLGRLFDGVAALIGITTTVEYEAKAAILLQKFAENFQEQNMKEVQAYSVSIRQADKLIIEHHKLIDEMICDLHDNKQLEEMAYKFHLWIVDCIMDILDTLNPQNVALSGGCFQNRLLTSLIREKMIKKNINFYFNEEVPINDAGISFGQTLA